MIVNATDVSFENSNQWVMIGNDMESWNAKCRHLSTAELIPRHFNSTGAYLFSASEGGVKGPSKFSAKVKPAKSVRGQRQSCLLYTSPSPRDS